MNTSLLAGLDEIGLTKRKPDGNPITQADIARAFKGAPEHLSRAVQGHESLAGYSMLMSIDFAIRLVRGQADADDERRLPFVAGRARRGLAMLAEELGGGDESMRLLRAAEVRL